MKISLTYKEDNLLKTPYINIFLKDYNTKYVGTGSYALCQKLQKKDKVLSIYDKEIVIFYDPSVDNIDTIKSRINCIRTEILTNLKQYLKDAKINVATEEEILAHQKQAQSEPSTRNNNR